MGNWDEFAAFMGAVQDAKDILELRPHQECFFRGHLHTGYKLLPSLFQARQQNGRSVLEIRAPDVFRVPNPCPTTL
jgi:hypothetical protein